VTTADIVSDADHKMDHAVEFAREEFAAIRTGRAHPAMFSKIVVEYYGAPTPLQQLASFQVPEARTILITPYDRGAMAATPCGGIHTPAGRRPACQNTSIGMPPRGYQ